MEGADDEAQFWEVKPPTELQWQDVCEFVSWPAAAKWVETVRRAATRCARE